jgi:hypothetical protein
MTLPVPQGIVLGESDGGKLTEQGSQRRRALWGGKSYDGVEERSAAAAWSS